MIQKNVLIEKAREAVDSVLPIALIVSVLCLCLVPVDSGLMLAFLVGTGMILAGMALFTLGSEQSMSQMGNLVGARLTKSKNILLILVLSFIMGAVITMSEPDLQVLATYVPGIDRMTLVLTVSVGVGLFLMVCMVRILLGFALRWLLLAFYAAVFLLAFRSDPGFLSVSFDSGGVTTGPMTVPFIMALGVGVASIRSDEKAKDDSFGLVALCSIGPILAVMLLGLLDPGSPGSPTLAGGGGPPPPEPPAPRPEKGLCRGEQDPLRKAAPPQRHRRARPEGAGSRQMTRRRQTIRRILATSTS